MTEDAETRELALGVLPRSAPERLVEAIADYVRHGKAASTWRQ